MLTMNGPQIPDWLRMLASGGGNAALTDLPPLTAQDYAAPAPAPLAPVQPTAAAPLAPVQPTAPAPTVGSSIPPALAPLTNQSPPVPPAMPSLPERTDLPDLTSYTGNIHKQYQPLIDMALNEMMQGSMPRQLTPLTALAALGKGLDYGTRNLRGLPQGNFSFGSDLADAQDMQRMKHALAAGNLLESLAGSEAANQRGLDTNIQAWQRYRQAEMDPRAQEFENLKGYNQGLTPLARADTLMERLPGQMAGDTAKNNLTNAKRDLVVTNNGLAQELAPLKVANQKDKNRLVGTNADTAAGLKQPKIDAATSRAAILKEQARVAASIADSDAKIKDARATLESFKAQNPNISAGRSGSGLTQEVARAKQLDAQIKQNESEYKMLESKLYGANPPADEQMVTLRSRLAAITATREDLAKQLNDAISKLPTNAARLMPTPAPKPGLADLAMEPTPTPLPDGAAAAATPGLDPTSPGRLVAQPTPEPRVVQSRGEAIQYLMTKYGLNQQQAAAKVDSLKKQ